MKLLGIRISRDEEANTALTLSATVGGVPKEPSIHDADSSDDTVSNGNVESSFISKQQRRLNSKTEEQQTVHAYHNPEDRGDEEDDTNNDDDNELEEKEMGNEEERPVDTETTVRTPLLQGVGGEDTDEERERGDENCRSSNPLPHETNGDDADDESDPVTHDSEGNPIQNQSPRIIHPSFSEEDKLRGDETKSSEQRFLITQTSHRAVNC
jgi:hypothetical protein